MKTKILIKMINSVLILSLGCLIQSPPALFLKRCMFVVVIASSLLIPGQWSQAETFNVEACAPGAALLEGRDG